MAQGRIIDMRAVDRAMGLELQAIELEDELEWAESQGRTSDVARLKSQLFAVLDELAAAADRIPSRLAA